MMKWTSRSKRNSLSAEKQKTSSSANGHSNLKSIEEKNVLRYSESTQSIAQESLYSDAKHSQSTSSISSNPFGGHSITSIPNSESISSINQPTISRTQSPQTLSESDFSKSLKNSKVTVSSTSLSSRPFQHDNYDDTVLKTSWINKGSNISNWNNITSDSWKMYKAELKGSTLSLYKLPSDLNIKAFDPQFNQVESQLPTTPTNIRQKRLSTASSRSNLKAEVKTPLNSIPITESYRTSKAKLLYKSEVYPHPDLELNSTNSIVSGTLESVCHTIIFNTLNDDKLSYNLLLILPLFGDVKESLKYFIEYSITFTSQKSSKNASNQKVLISNNTDYAVTQRLRLVISTIIDTFPGMLLDNDVSDLIERLLIGISQHDENLTENIRKLFIKKQSEMKELTSFTKRPFDSNGSLSLTNIESFLKLDSNDLTHQINIIDLKFNQFWNPKSDPSLLYELENVSYTRLNPLIFNSTTNIHYLGRILVNHLFGSLECKRSDLKRAQVLSKWIEIGCIFDKIGDMVSWLAIATIICSMPILRLRKTWSLVNDKYLKIISNEWAPVVFELDRRTMISEASHRSSYHVIAPQGLGVTYSKSNVVPYFGDLTVKYIENSTLKNCEKRVQRVKVSFNRWDEYLQNVEEASSLSSKSKFHENPELIKQLINSFSNHTQLPPLTQFSVMELSLSIESDNVGPYSENDQRTPLITGSYLPTLFSEIIPSYRLFNQNVLIGASGFPTQQLNSNNLQNFSKITGIQDIDIKSHQLNQNLPAPSKQHTFLKSVRDIFNIGSDVYHVDDVLIFKSLGNSSEEWKSSRPVSVVIENPSSKRLSKISNHRLSQFSGSNRASINFDTSQGDEIDLFASLDNSDVLNSLMKPLNVVLKAGTFEKMVDVLVLTANVFSKKIDKEDVEHFTEKFLDNQFFKLKMNNGVYTTTFFTTYKSFVTTSELLESLTKRFVGAKSCALSIQKFNDSNSSINFPDWSSNISNDDPNVNWKYVGNIQIGILEALFILVSEHYSDFTNDLKNKSIFIELLKIIDNDVVVLWKDILLKFEDSIELKNEMNEIYNALSNLYKKLRKDYIKKCYRPLDLYPRGLPNVDGEFNIDISGFALPTNFREAESFVNKLDIFVNRLFQKTSISDWIYVFQLLEVQSSKSLTSLFRFKNDSNKSEDQLEILNIFSWIQSLYGDNIEDKIIKKFPPPVKLLFDVHTNLENLFKFKISDVNINKDERALRLVSILQTLTIARLRMKSADLFNTSSLVNGQLSPHVPSFIESAITQAIVSPESRLFVDSWIQAASALKDQPIQTINEVLGLLPSFEVADLSEGLKRPLTPCIGWFVERLLEISNYVPNMSIENSKLINFDKRRFTYNCISNIIDMNSTNNSNDEANNKPITDEVNKEFDILYKLKNARLPDFPVLLNISSLENKDPNNKLFRPLISTELEKIKRDSNKRETLENQERDIKRTQLLSQATASLSLNKEIPPPNEQQRKGRQNSASSTQTASSSPSKVASGVGKKLGGLFRSVRPFSINVGSNWSGPDKIIHPDDLPDINVVDLSGKHSKPYQQIQLFKYKPLFVHSNIEGFFKIVSDRGGEEFCFQATSNEEARNWIAALNLSKRYTYLSKDSKGLTSSKVFGVPISDVCEREGTLIPKIVERLLQEIEVRGLDETGLYRIPGSVVSINLLKQAFDEGGEFTLEDDRWFEINTLAGCFKSYLRELPETLFTTELLSEFVEATKYGSLEENLRNLIPQLPLSNYHLLKRLFEHLNKVIQHSEKNRMDAVNLAIVFSMSFLNNDSLGASMGSDLGALQSILQFLIKTPGSVFTEEQSIQDN